MPVEDDTAIESLISASPSTVDVSCAFGDVARCDTIIALKRFSACLSLIGCMFMIFIIWLFNKTQSFAQRLILYLSIAALAVSAIYLIGGLHPDGTWCDLQAFLLTWFEWAVLMWVCGITLNLFLLVVRSIRTENWEWLYHVACWGLPLCIACLPFIGNHYGPAGAWCWISSTSSHSWQWRIGIWYAPLFLIIALLFAAYINIIYTVRKKAQTWEGNYNPETEWRKKMMSEDVKPLRGYPFVYLVLSVIPLINRIQNAISHEQVFWLVCLHVLLSPLTGACNALVFGLDPITRTQLTWIQVKSEWMKRRSGRAEIREYPAGQSYGANDGDPQI